MSWEDTNCPCGDRKERETMLCAACEDYLAGHPAMKHFRDTECPVAGRRHAAIVLLTCARARKRHQTRQVPPNTKASDATHEH